MNVDRRLILIITGGVALIVVATLWGMRQREAQLVTEASYFRAQWGPAGDYQQVCRADLPERIGPIDATARVAFWAPRDVNSANSTMRSLGNRRPLATGKTDLTHVACVRFVRVVAETCAYEGGSRMDRRRYDAEVSLVDMKARVVVAKWRAEGKAPNPCPEVVRRRSGDPQPPPLDGPEPNFVGGLYELEPFKRP